MHPSATRVSHGLASESLAWTWRSNWNERLTFKTGTIVSIFVLPCVLPSKTRVGFYSFSNKMETVAGFETTHDEARQNVKECELLGGNTNYRIMTERVVEVFAQTTASHKYTILLTNGKGTESKDDVGRHPYTEGNQF